MTVEAGTPGMSFDGVADYCHALGVEYIRAQVPIYEVVFLAAQGEESLLAVRQAAPRCALSTAMNEHWASRRSRSATTTTTRWRPCS